MLDFSTFSVSDFDDEDFRSLYLSHHQARIEPDLNNNQHVSWTLVWPSGFVRAVPYDYGESLAKLWGCVFILFYKYKKENIIKAKEQASRHVENFSEN